MMSGYSRTSCQRTASPASSPTSSYPSSPASSHPSSPPSPVVDRSIRTGSQQEGCQDLPYGICHSPNLWRFRRGEKSGQESGTLGSPNWLSGVSPSDITIGVELEMVLVKRFEIDHYKLVRESLAHLADTLGVSVPDLGRNMVSSMLVPDLGRVFQVKSDMTVSCKSWEKRNILAAALEIATPILRNGSWTWVIPATCKAIKSLAAQPTTIDAVFNNSTGLHVHIGIGRPYTLAELKRISKAIVLFEEEMDKNHPKHRIPTDPMGSSFRGCLDSLVFRRLTKSQIMELIDRCLTIQELLCTINGTGPDRKEFLRLYKYNLTSVQTYGTIEFRQGAGTVKGQRIVNWIGCIIRFITKAMETRDEEYAEWAGMKDIPPELCRLFGAPSPAGYGKRDRLRTPKKRVPMRFRLSKRAKRIYLSKKGI